ncbi:unnamed protein product [Prunus armeniaca]
MVEERLQIIIWGQKSTIPTFAQDNLAAHNSYLSNPIGVAIGPLLGGTWMHKDARCAVNKINNSADALDPAWEPNSFSSAEFDAWWKARFQGLPASSTALKILFDGWDS